MKKIFIIVLTFVLCSVVYAKEADSTDRSVYNQIVYMYSNGFYDSSIHLINQLKEEFPNSSLIEECEFIKGQCLYYQKKYNQALKCFFSVCKNIDNLYYNQSILYSARSFFMMQEFNEAIPLYEFIVLNGNNFSKNDYVESLKKLFICYNNTGNKSKTENLVKKINKDDFGLETYNQLLELKDSVLADYYLAKKMLEENKIDDCIKILSKIEHDVEKSNNQSFKDSYYALLIRCYAIKEKWDLIPSAFDKIVQKNNNVIYFAAYAYYNTKNYAKVITLLENKTYLQDMYKISVALESFKNQDYEKSLRFSQTIKNAYAEYLSGLNYINLKNWKKAILHFESFLKTNPKNEYLARFYKGYAEFLLNQSEKSLKTFEQYLDNSKNNKLINRKYEQLAYEYSLRNAINLKNHQKIMKLADELLSISTSEKEKQALTIFVAEIYSDFSDYVNAIKLLQPYEKEFSEKNLNALYTLATIYEKNEDFENAHRLYSSIYKKFSKDNYGIQSLFRQAQLYYSNKDFKNAEDCFYEFIYKYPNDENLVSAMYYCSECYLKNGKKQNALMMCNTIVSSFPYSAYDYASYKNLVSIYYDLNDYSSALETTNILIKKYPAQVGADGIIEKQKELTKIVAGTDKEIAKKYAEYSKIGNNSVKGRILGTELVSLYMKNNFESEEGFELASDLVLLQTSEKETFYKAQNYENIAHYYMSKQNYKNAAESFLQATEFYRITDKTKPAETLYLCVECFNFAKMYSDAEETAKVLINLYPDTDYAKNVKKLLKNR